MNKYKNSLKETMCYIEKNKKKYIYEMKKREEKERSSKL